ncbi:MAG: helix-turn-helix domain-containing protein [Solirubrobacterales bacterium]
MRDAQLAAAFGELLSAARREAGMTQEALAHRSGLDRTAISQLELGKASPRLETIVRIAGALDLDPCALIPALRWQPPASAPAPAGRFIRR